MLERCKGFTPGNYNAPALLQGESLQEGEQGTQEMASKDKVTERKMKQTKRKKKSIATLTIYKKEKERRGRKSCG